MHIPDAPLFDPEHAIWNKNASALKSALDAGWQLPYARVREVGMVPDYGLVIRVISLRWTEGWRLMAQAFPQLYEIPVLWQLALRLSVPGILEDFLTHGRSAVDKLESGQEPLHLLTESMERGFGEPIADEDVIESIQILRDAGASLTSPYPGVPQERDLSGKGHTTWTRSLSYGRWAVANAFMPSTWQEFLGMPRALESLHALRSGALREEAARRTWKAWATRFIEPWLAMNKTDPFSSVIDLQLLPELSPTLRAVVWQRWSELDAAGWSSLHDLALLGNHAVAHQALACALQDQAPCLALWESASEDGLRPSDLWEMANGRAAPEKPSVPANLPELQHLAD